MKQDIKDLTAEEFLSSARNRILNEAAMASAYEQWTDEFSRKDIRKEWNNSISERKLSLDEILSLGKEKLSGFGFHRWDENLRCIPLWAWNYIADDIILTSIDGTARSKNSDEIDLDVRFGCIAWGFSEKLVVNS